MENQAILDLIKSKELECETFEVLSNKDGVVVVELSALEGRPVLKYFEKEIYRREIAYYRLFDQWQLKTMSVLAYYPDGLLLENIHENPDFDLTSKADLEEKTHLVALAQWYRALHEKGRIYAQENKDLYSEMALIDAEAIGRLQDKHASHKDFWLLLKKKNKGVQAYVDTHKTLTYNDFFYGNMIHSQNLDEAYMFDYNFVGTGLVYFDISNVLSGLPQAMHKHFLKAYGPIGCLEKEINDVFSHVICLILAYERDLFPQWGQASLDLLEAGVLYDRLKTLNI